MHLSAFLPRLGAQERSREDHREELVFFFSQDRKEQEQEGRELQRVTVGKDFPEGRVEGMKSSGVLPRSTRTWP